MSPLAQRFLSIKWFSSPLFAIVNDEFILGISGYILRLFNVILIPSIVTILFELFGKVCVCDGSKPPTMRMPLLKFRTNPFPVR